ncbi:hypothetical protein [uncultured Paracoccus sp.]|nr:hypothetical protein [uncultured Paracoccus sp.]
MQFFALSSLRAFLYTFRMILISLNNMTCVPLDAASDVIGAAHR